MCTEIRGGLLRCKNEFQFRRLITSKTKIMKTIFIFLFSAAILIICQQSYAQSGTDQSGITLQLVSNKTEYLEGEKIWLTATALNKGSKIDSITMFNEVGLMNYTIVQNIYGENFPVRYFSASYRKIPQNILNPGEMERVNYGILYSHAPIREGESWDNFYLQPDSYVVYIEHTLRYGDTMKVRSNEIRFTVVEPDLEERKILNEFRKINGMPFKTPYEKIKKANAYYELLNTENISRSKYYEQTFRNYASFISLGNVQTDSKIFIADCKKFSNTFPNSYYLGPVLYAIASMLKNIDEKEEIVPVFVELKINNYDTRLSDAVDSILKNKQFREYYLK